MYNYLHQKPQIGMISGVISGIILKLQNFITDDNYLKIASNLGAYASCAIAFVALVIQVIKLYDTIRVRIKIKKP
jgi:hypothetical protein